MKIRYKLHWNTAGYKFPTFKWVIYDWKYKCPIAYSETRIQGRDIVNFLNKVDERKLTIKLDGTPSNFLKVAKRPPAVKVVKIKGK